MAKLTLQLNKLENPEVTHISLVTRAASRIPFRIIKQEKDMIDLTKIFKKDLSNAGDSPVLVGVIVEKFDGFDATTLSADLLGLGFETKEIDETFENVTIFKTAGIGAEEESLLVRVSDHTLVMVSKAELPDLALFAEELEGGFYVGLDYATTKLNNVTREAIAKNEPTLATKATEEYNQYLTAYTAVMPELTFKIDELVTKACKDKKAHKDMEMSEAASNASEDDTETTKKVDDQNSDTSGKSTVEEETKNLVLKFGDMLTELTTKMETSMTSLQSAIDAANKAMDEKINGIQTSVNNLDTKVNDVETVAKAATEAVKGTVLGAPPAGDDSTAVKKAETIDPRSGVFDTAYITRPSRNTRQSH